MPTDVSYPLNMQVNNVVLSRSGAKWKAFQFKHQPFLNTENPPKGGSFVYPKRYNIPGMARPFFNKQGGSSYEAGAKSINPDEDGKPETLAYTGTGAPYADYTGVGDGNAFRARPIKHWRLQYGNTNGKQSYKNRYQIRSLSQPGGALVNSSDRREINAGVALEAQIKQWGGTKCRILCDGSISIPEFDVSDCTTTAGGGLKAKVENIQTKLLEDGGDTGGGGTSTSKPDGTIESLDDDKIHIWNNGTLKHYDLCYNENCAAIVGQLPTDVGKLTKVGRYNPIYFQYNIPPWNCQKYNLDTNDSLWTSNYYPSKAQSCAQCPLYQCKITEIDIQNENTTGGLKAKIQSTEISDADESGGITDDNNNSDNPVVIEKDCGAIRKCINICDPPTKARRRVRYSSRINRVDLCERPYYVDFKNYMKARCKTFKQNSFQFTLKGVSSESIAPCSCSSNTNSRNTGPNTDCNKCCGLSAYDSGKDGFRSNCPSVANISTCQGGNVKGAYSDTCSKVYYKPNNCQYAQQGAVSGSSRILRLKMQTINKNARSVGNAYGTNASSALAYSSRPQAPFINKQKMNAGGYSKKCQNTTFKYPCDTSLYHLYRPGGGNPTTSGMNDKNNNRIIGHFCTTSIWPGQGDGKSTSPDNGFIFMERQDKQVRLTGIGSRYGGDSGTGQKNTRS